MKKAKRCGMVVGLSSNPEKRKKYLELHDDSHPGVRHVISDCNIRNFSIFMRELDDGKEYLFLYWDYVGDDYEADMEKMDNHPDVKKWLEICDPCQVPLQGETSWAEMKEVYHND